MHEESAAQESFLDFEREAENMSKRAYSRMGFAFAALLVVWYGMHLFITALAETFWPYLMRQSWFVLLVNDISLYAVALSVYYFLIRKMPKRVPEQFSLTPGNLASSVLMAYGLLVSGSIMGTAVSLILDLAAGTTTVSSISTLLDGKGNFFLMFFLVAILAPVMEELIFRKLMLERLRQYGRWTAITVSSLLFACMHGNLLQFFYAFLLGMLFGYLYERTGKLSYSIFLHFLINGFSTLLSYVMGDLSDLSEMPLGEAVQLLWNADPDTLIRFTVTALMVLCEYAMAAVGVAQLLKRRKSFFLPTAGTQNNLTETGVAAVIVSPGMVTALAVSLAVFLLPYFIG